MATQATAQAFLARLEALGSPVEQDKLRRYFQAGESPDRTADMFLGVRMADVFALAKEFVDLPPGEIDQLLASPIHEARAGGLSIMGKQATRKRTPERRRKELYELYLRRTERINDWDLVDISAHQVVGGYLLDKPRDVLYELARSPRWWERRVAMFATLAFVRRGDHGRHLHARRDPGADEHDLVQKVVGGMLREAGKHDRARLLRFLDTHAAAAPRVLLRYAIEHLDPEQRAHYLSVQPRGGPRGVRQASG
jgi:3-methyladenine DNA glycosylase AlkD